jgi:hypothetical protein
MENVALVVPDVQTPCAFVHNLGISWADANTISRALTEPLAKHELKKQVQVSRQNKKSILSGISYSFYESH